MEEDYELLGETAEGKITAIGTGEVVDTKFGERKRIPITVDLGGNNAIDINIWVAVKGSSIRPNSNAGRLLKKCNVKKLSELIGKKVPLRIDTRGFHRFDV